MAYSPRPVPKKRPTTPPTGTDLEGRLRGAAQSGGGIQAGAHPELENPSGPGNPFKQIASLLKPRKKKAK